MGKGVPLESPDEGEALNTALGTTGDYCERHAVELGYRATGAASEVTDTIEVGDGEPRVKRGRTPRW